MAESELDRDTAIAAALAGIASARASSPSPPPCRRSGRRCAGRTGARCVGAWLGLRERSRQLDSLALAMLSDVGAPPPLLRPRERARVHGRPHDPLPHAPCFGRLRTRLIHEGFFEDDGVIWADGTVLAQSRQLAVLMPVAGG